MLEIDKIDKLLKESVTSDVEKNKFSKITKHIYVTSAEGVKEDLITNMDRMIGLDDDIGGKHIPITPDNFLKEIPKVITLLDFCTKNSKNILLVGDAAESCIIYYFLLRLHESFSTDGLYKIFKFIQNKRPCLFPDQRYVSIIYTKYVDIRLI